jgi:glyceraldehyde-3-phosphate dehydrogenase/erythrose-4-phosphate dehydrogenase
MRVPAPTANCVGLSVSLTETQRKAAINSPFQSSREPRDLEDWLEVQPQLFAMLEIYAHS